MNKSAIKQYANELTERKAEGISGTFLDWTLMKVLQDFCLEKRWHWRKKTLTFSTVIGTNTYDLASITTTPANQGIHAEEFISVRYVKSPTDLPDLTPVFDTRAQEEIIADTTTGEPGVYFVEPGTYQTLRINPPAGVYTIRATFWAVPNEEWDDPDDAIPLVPRYLHLPVVVPLLEAEIWRSVYGAQSAKYLTAKAAADRAVERAMGKGDFATGAVRTFTPDQAAIRST